MEEQGSKRLFVLDILIMAGIVILVIYAINVYSDKAEITHNIQQHAYNDKEKETFVIAYNFTAKTFSAQTPIKVSAIAKISDEIKSVEPEMSKNLKQILIYFPTSTPEKIEYNEVGAILSYPLLLTRGADDLFRGNTTITYLHEGAKCSIPSITVLEKTENCLPDSPSIISIASADVKFQLENNKIILFLTLIFLAFTVIVMRDFISGVGHNFSLLRKKRKDDKIKPKPK